MKIKIKLSEDKQSLVFDYGDKKKLIRLKDEADNDLNEMYDYILENIEVIEIDDSEIGYDSDDTSMKVAAEIVKILKSEFVAIKREKSKFEAKDFKNNQNQS